ncbi:MAG: ribonuclease E/G [Lachnospiraceae bacterium]|nr:ribonuclease E/G [Lachnospiraceae bacterium]
MHNPLIILSQSNKILSLLYQESRLVQANAYPKEGSDLEAIYIGKVKNVVPSLEAAFVEYQAGETGFLPLKRVKNPLLTNRAYDGRLVAGDELLVQVEKEGIKTKSPGLTCNLSFTGKYAVLTLGIQTLGYSGKLSKTQKEYLSSALMEKLPEERPGEEKAGLIIRTNAGELEDLQPLFQELDQLLALKNRVLKEAMHRTCFSCLYQPAPAWLCGVRDLYGFSYDKILTDDPEIFKQIREYLPDETRLELYQDQRISLERLYNVKTRIAEALAEKVWLKSGAYLIIQPTEALTVIDVNSGKQQKKKPGDDIFYRINQEAAKEIALQLRLRNISGIIIIDFISQDSDRLDKQLLQELTNLVRMDPVQTDVIDITPLGLVELTRKKINKSLKEQLESGK